MNKFVFYSCSKTFHLKNRIFIKKLTLYLVICIEKKRKYALMDFYFRKIFFDIKVNLNIARIQFCLLDSVNSH